MLVLNEMFISKLKLFNRVFFALTFDVLIPLNSYYYLFFLFTNMIQYDMIEIIFLFISFKNITLIALRCSLSSLKYAHKYIKLQFIWIGLINLTFKIGLKTWAIERVHWKFYHFRRLKLKIELWPAQFALRFFNNRFA